MKKLLRLLLLASAFSLPAFSPSAFAQPQIPWTNISNKPTTLAGMGIANGATLDSFGSSLTLPSLNLTGTAGAGFITLPSQSSPPAAPASGNIRVYSDPSNKFAWIGASGFTRSFDGTLTASRAFTLPDVSGTFVLDSANQTLTNKSINASEINSGSLSVGNGGTAATSLGSSLTNAAATLNTIQGIRTSDTPQFAQLGLGAAPSIAYLDLRPSSAIPTGATFGTGGPLGSALKITGTLDGSANAGATAFGIFIDLTASGSGFSCFDGLASHLSAGGAVSGKTKGIDAHNVVAGTNAFSVTGESGNMGAFLVADGTGGSNIGSWNQAANATSLSLGSFNTASSGIATAIGSFNQVNSGQSGTYSQVGIYDTDAHQLAALHSNHAALVLDNAYYSSNAAFDSIVGITGGTATPTMLWRVDYQGYLSAKGIKNISGSSNQFPRDDGTWQSIVTSLAGTSNQVAVSSSTGGVTVSLPAAITGVNSFTAAASTDLTIAAGSGGNNNVAINTTGTGTVNINGTVRINGGQVILTSGGGAAFTSNVSTNGNFVLGGAASRITFPSGANGSSGSCTLSAGTVTVSNTSITAKSIIILQHQPNDAGTLTAAPFVSTATVGSGFTVVAGGTDTAVLNYAIVEKQ